MILETDDWVIEIEARAGRVRDGLSPQTSTLRAAYRHADGAPRDSDVVLALRAMADEIERRDGYR